MPTLAPLEIVRVTITQKLLMTPRSTTESRSDPGVIWHRRLSARALEVHARLMTVSATIGRRGVKAVDGAPSARCRHQLAFSLLSGVESTSASS